MHLRCISLVILVFKVIFVCFQTLSTKYARRCILEAFGACFGLGMDSKCMGQVDGRIWELKRPRIWRIMVQKMKKTAQKSVTPTCIPCHANHIEFPLDSHAMLDHSCPLHNFWFHASIHLIITLNCLIPLVPFTHKILYNFHNHNMHQLMLHHSHLESHALCTTCCCTFDPFIDTFSPPFPSLCNVHNHSCSLATTPLHFTLHTLHHYFIFTLGPLHTTHTNCHAFHP